MDTQLTDQELTRLIQNDNALRAWRRSFEAQLRRALPLLNGSKDPGPSTTELVNLLRALIQTTILVLDVTVPHTTGE